VQCLAGEWEHIEYEGHQSSVTLPFGHSILSLTAMDEVPHVNLDIGSHASKNIASGASLQDCSVTFERMKQETSKTHPKPSTNDLQIGILQWGYNSVIASHRPLHTYPGTRFHPRAFAQRWRPISFVVGFLEVRPIFRYCPQFSRVDI
jgi:hypothetical protein